jgi:hypothetical protein
MTPHEMKSVKRHDPINETQKLEGWGRRDLLSVKLGLNFVARFLSRSVYTCTKYYYDFVSDNTWKAIQT